MRWFNFFKKKKTLEEIAEELACYCLADTKSVGGFVDITGAIPEGRFTKLFVEYLRLRIIITDAALECILGDTATKDAMSSMFYRYAVDHTIGMLRSREKAEQVFAFPLETLKAYYDIMESDYDEDKELTEYADALFKFAGMDTRTNKEALERDIFGFTLVYGTVRLFLSPAIGALIDRTNDLLKMRK